MASTSSQRLPSLSRRLLIGVAGATLLFACAGSETALERQEKTESSSEVSSHERMVVELRRVRDRTAAENRWLGEGPLLETRARLEALRDRITPASRWHLLNLVAEHELRMGYEGEAIESFLEGYSMLSVVGDTVPRERRLESLFRIAVAYLRYGETRNCVARHSADSCILPIRPGGVHTDEEGSRQAIRFFEELLGQIRPSDPLHLKAVWLLNIAYMTVGGYPHEVPEGYRVPTEIFSSDVSFPRFENVAPSLGLDTVNLSGGAVAEDFDGDGLLDIFTTTFDTAVAPRYFRNQGDGTFLDATGSAGLEGLYGGLNVVHADYDNDGDPDLYVLRGAWLYDAGRHPNSLLRNDGNGVFEDVTFDVGLGEVHFPTQTAAWADYDNDGDLDLYVGNEHGDGAADVADVADRTPSFAAPSQLFRNNGVGADGRVTFTDVARHARAEVRDYVKGVVWGDYDNDRFPDLYLSVLGGRNRLFHNLGDGTFEEVAEAAGVSGPHHSFPVWFWDYDNDGNLDLYVSSYRGDGSVALVAASYFGQPVPWDLPRLYRGDGRGGFEDVSRDVGLTRLHLPMGSNYGDVDNDGFLDFYLGTGYPDYEGVMPNVFYLNRGGERFLDITLAAGFGHLQKGHAVAFADFDHDGDQDIFEQMGGALPGDRFGDALFLNPGTDNHWIAVRLVGDDSNRSALGARLRVDFVDQGRRRSVHRHVSSGGSFGGNPLRQTLGLGGASRVERLEVYWPTTDVTQTFVDVTANRFYRITEGEPQLVDLDL